MPRNLRGPLPWAALGLTLAAAAWGIQGTIPHSPAQLAWSQTPGPGEAPVAPKLPSAEPTSPANAPNTRSTTSPGTTVAAAPVAPTGLRLEPVLLTLIEQVEVPAQEAGILARLEVREGDIVRQGQSLAQVEDAEARLEQERARIEREIASRKAKNDIEVRFARKSQEVAQAELKRATDAVERFQRSVSQSELDHLQLQSQKATLEVEQATHNFQVGQLTLELHENQLALAARSVQRRQIAAPLDGVVAQIKQHRGEWVEPGETVLRILRIDRLRAEGFLSARQVRNSLIGSPVKLMVDLPDDPQAVFTGTLVFVSPEIDPVNNQVRIWAEIENRDLLLRPGLNGVLDIQPAAK